MRCALRDWPSFLRLWREVLVGAALIGAALGMGFGTFGITRWLAIVAAALGVLLVWSGVQRRRFARGGGGPGVVTVDERRVVYWGPLTGGVIDLDDLLRLEFDPGGRPAHWVLTPLSGEALAIPTSAEGAEALFDVFAALPGLKVEAMLAALGRSGGPKIVLWQAPNVVPFPGPERLLN